MSGKTEMTVPSFATREQAVNEQTRLFPRKNWNLEGTDGTPENPRVSMSRAPMLPEICIELRASINGAADPLPDQFLRECHAMLMARVATWLESKSTIDDAVKVMCVAAVRMVKQELEHRDQQNFHVN